MGCDLQAFYEADDGPRGIAYRAGYEAGRADAQVGTAHEQLKLVMTVPAVAAVATVGDGSICTAVKTALVRTFGQGYDRGVHAAIEPLLQLPPVKHCRALTRGVESSVAVVRFTIEALDMHNKQLIRSLVVCERRLCIAATVAVAMMLACAVVAWFAWF